jgi:hypothetical protein
MESYIVEIYNKGFRKKFVFSVFVIWALLEGQVVLSAGVGPGFIL